MCCGTGWLLHSAQPQSVWQLRAMGLSTHRCKRSPPAATPPSICRTKAQEVPGHSQCPTCAACQGLRAQEEAMPRGEGSAATSSSQPVQVIVIIVTKERCRRGTPLHAHFLLILLFRGNLRLQRFRRCCFKEVVILKEAGIRVPGAGAQFLRSWSSSHDS